MTQTGVTDEQLVELAEALGFEVDKPPRHTEMPPWLMNPIGQPVRWLRAWEGAGAVQTAMAGLGWTMMTLCRPGQNAKAEFSRAAEESYYYGDAPEMPEAICLAARAALGLGGAK